MNRRSFLTTSLAASAAGPLSLTVANPRTVIAAPQAAADPGVSILVVDTDRVTAPVDERIYGHFLEHINHSVEDGLFAEQIQGWGFEGEDFKTFWESFADRGKVGIEEIVFQGSTKSVRLDFYFAAVGK